MRGKLLLKVYLAATQATYEFLVPYDLTVAEVASLMARMLEARASPYYVLSANVSLMLLGGSDAGKLLEGSELVCGLVRAGTLVDGRLVALV